MVFRNVSSFIFFAFIFCIKSSFAMEETANNFLGMPKYSENQPIKWNQAVEKYEIFQVSGQFPVFEFGGIFWEQVDGRLLPIFCKETELRIAGNVPKTSSCWVIGGSSIAQSDLNSFLKFLDQKNKSLKSEAARLQDGADKGNAIFLGAVAFFAIKLLTRGKINIDESTMAVALAAIGGVMRQYKESEMNDLILKQEYVRRIKSLSLGEAKEKPYVEGLAKFLHAALIEWAQEVNLKTTNAVP